MPLIGTVASSAKRRSEEPSYPFRKGAAVAQLVNDEALTDAGYDHCGTDHLRYATQTISAKVPSCLRKNQSPVRHNIDATVHATPIIQT